MRDVLLIFFLLAMVCRTASTDRLYSEEYILDVHHSGHRRLTEVIYFPSSCWLIYMSILSP